ncbi:MAG: archaemetzincin family Zn-dependent metalloprotease [Deltaproteobacteria bacterium]|nr:archaemetzincin family Zn-dependent metalloprotease [Deltaproteobacteria bacterium]
MSYIYIIPIDTEPESWLAPLETSIQNTFGLQTKCSSYAINLPAALDPERRQYNSSQILLQLIDSPPADASRIIGVAAVDLFIPILTFVFGEAQLGGIGAVISLHRLNNRFYGLPENRELLTERIVKEAVHELGHTFGLLHCSNPACVLTPSTYAEDIDQKSSELCPQCRQQLQESHPNPARPD